MESLLKDLKNLAFVHDFFSNIFSKPPIRNENITRSRAKISRVRAKVVASSLSQQFDAPITLSELSDAIQGLANGKTPGPDGLPNEFYKSFSELLCPFLLRIWQETMFHGSLPASVNSGVIKLIHKRGEKNNINNWRPITCLNSIYKIFALVLAKRVSPHLDSLILKEQKGFIKGRYILDAIITLWEGMEYINDNNLDMLFSKIDFDKAYDRVEWDFILQSLQDMGFGKTFTKYVHCLFGNAKTFVALNGQLSPSISLMRSIRQGCPLAPLLFVMVADALGWLVQDAIQQGQIQGVAIPGIEKDLCLQQFADDTNSFIHNDSVSVSSFMNCLDTFCQASGSLINHSKTGVWSSSNNIPLTVTQSGCDVIQNGTIFRLLCIPMGFGITLKDRWAWILNKFKGKLIQWKGYQPNLSSRLFVLNHYILPSLIYFLSCWRPPQAHLKLVNSLVTNFLWGGDGTSRKMVKVAYKTCVLPKHLGGLGLMDLNHMSLKLSAKWIVRSMGCLDYWAVLIQRNCTEFQLRDLKAWKGFNHWEIFLSRRRFIPKGSDLVKGLWSSWEEYRIKMLAKSNPKAQDFLMDKDSLWVGMLSPDLGRDALIKAHKLWKAGFRNWKDLASNNQWDQGKISSAPFHLRYLLMEKIHFVAQAGFWPPSTVAVKWRASQVCQWHTGKLFSLFPLVSLIIM